MDLITHGLAGGLVAQAGFAQRIGRPAMIALVAGAMLPDVDVVMALVDELSVVRYHRGLTHSLVGAFLLALPLAVVLYRFGRYKRFWPLIGLGALGVLTHIALDLPTSFGTMVFTPFSHERYALNLIFIIDPIYSGIILLALGLGHWRRRWARTPAILGISGLLLYMGEHTILEYYDLRFGAAPHHDDFRLEVVLDGGDTVKRIRLNHRF